MGPMFEVGDWVIYEGFRCKVLAREFHPGLQAFPSYRVSIGVGLVPESYLNLDSRSTLSIDIEDLYSQLKEKTKRLAEVYNERIKFWIGSSAYDISTAWSGTKVEVTYMVERSADYEDYQTVTYIPLEYFLQGDDYKDYKRNLDNEAKIKEAEEKLAKKKQRLYDIDQGIERLNKEKYEIVSNL